MRTGVSPRYRVDERWTDLRLCLELGGYGKERDEYDREQDRFIPIEPKFEGAAAVEDELTKELRRSGLPDIEGIVQVLDGSARSRQRLTRETFLDGFADEKVRGVAERLLDVVMRSGCEIYYGDTYGVSIRAKYAAREQPISVAWLYSREGKGWMRTRDFSFGASVLDYELPEELRTILERWTNQFSVDNFTDDVSSKGTACTCAPSWMPCSFISTALLTATISVTSIRHFPSLSARRSTHTAATALSTSASPG